MPNYKRTRKVRSECHICGGGETKYYYSRELCRALELGDLWTGVYLCRGCLDRLREEKISKSTKWVHDGCGGEVDTSGLYWTCKRCGRFVSLAECNGNSGAVRSHD